MSNFFDINTFPQDDRPTAAYSTHHRIASNKYCTVPSTRCSKYSTEVPTSYPKGEVSYLVDILASQAQGLSYETPTTFVP